MELTERMRSLIPHLRHAMESELSAQRADFERILNRMQIARRTIEGEVLKARKSIAQTLPDLHIFDVPVDLLEAMDLVHDERIVTGFLAWLFGPQPTTIFGGESPLSLFLTTIAAETRQETLSAIAQGRYKLYGESTVEGGKSPDLWIEIMEPRQIVVIEIKLDSSESFYGTESVSQTTEYRLRAVERSKRIGAGNPLLIFLTANGRQAMDADGPWLNCSFLAILVTVLRLLEQKSEPTVTAILKSYGKSIATRVLGIQSSLKTDSLPLTKMIELSGYLANLQVRL